MALSLIIVMGALAIAIASSGCGQLLGSGSDDDDNVPPPNPTSLDGGGGSDSDSAVTNADGAVLVSEINCLDGVDDDGDGLVDCADPDCTTHGYECRSAPPEGWELVELYRSPYKPPGMSSTPSPCLGASEAWLVGPKVNVGDTCATCTCPPNPCDVAVTCTDAPNCMGPATVRIGPLAIQPVGCQKKQPTALGPAAWCVAFASPPGVACQPTTEPIPLGDPPWNENVALCLSGAAGKRGGAGCEASGPGQVCLPTNTAGSGRACIRQTGKRSCPPVEWTSLDRLYPPTSKDPRACSACACIGASNVSCNPHNVTLYSSGTCGGDVNAGCANIETTNEWSVKLDAPVGSTTSCTPAGGLVDNVLGDEIVCCAP